MTIRRHYIKPRRVFFDLETGGTNPRKHPITQIAAVAFDEDWQECGRFEVKVCFHEIDADPEALQKNHYDKALWAKHGVEPLTAHKRFSYFLREHATVEKVSKAGKTYHHAQLFAHNAAFDADFLWTWHKDLKEKHKGENLYLPAEWQVLCTYQRAMFLFHENPELPRPENFKLGTLCDYCNIPFSVNESHDALYDCIASARLYQVVEQYEYEADELEEAA